MNIKYSSNENNTNNNNLSSCSIVKDAIDVDNDQKFLKYELNYKKDLTEKTAKETISEIDLENEVYRLRNVLKKLTEDFSSKRQQLEDDCCEQLRKLNENADQTHRLQQDLEQG
jgi:phage terminase large subunit